MTQRDEHRHVELDKSADVLQAHFKHYFEMAMDHHTKAATTSNILLIIVGAIVTLIGIDSQLSGTTDLLGGLGILVIGCFGAIWARKQHERYHYWANIAEQYQTELAKIVPLLEPANLGSEYAKNAAAYSEKEFGKFFARKLRDRYLWVSLHAIIALVGVAVIIRVVLQ